jgi:hypothetical protein
MAPSAKPNFSSLFISPWPGDASDDSDFAGNQQSDISTNKESIMSGDNQVVAEGCAADGDDEDWASGLEAAHDNSANDKDDIDLGMDSSGEERCAQSLYTTMTTKLCPAQGWQSHSQKNRLASC